MEDSVLKEFYSAEQGSRQSLFILFLSRFMIYSSDENSIMMKALDTSDASVKDLTSEIRKSSPINIPSLSRFFFQHHLSPCMRVVNLLPLLIHTLSALFFERKYSQRKLSRRISQCLPRKCRKFKDGVIRGGVSGGRMRKRCDYPSRRETD